ncbi:Ubiquitin-60S ribosomal protein L40, variant 2 [Balamuthia mandrillaris]
MVLSFGGKVLRDELSFRDYAIHKESTIFLTATSCARTSYSSPPPSFPSSSSSSASSIRTTTNSALPLSSQLPPSPSDSFSSSSSLFSPSPSLSSLSVSSSSSSSFFSPPSLSVPLSSFASQPSSSSPFPPSPFSSAFLTTNTTTETTMTPPPIQYPQPPAYSFSLYNNNAAVDSHRTTVTPTIGCKRKCSFLQPSSFNPTASSSSCCQVCSIMQPSPFSLVAFSRCGHVHCRDCVATFGDSCRLCRFRQDQVQAIHADPVRS